MRPLLLLVVATSLAAPNLAMAQEHHGYTVTASCQKQCRAEKRQSQDAYEACMKECLK